MLLGAREQTAGRDAHGDERPVVGAPVERGRPVGQVLRVEVALNTLLDRAEPVGRPVPNVGPVAVVDEAARSSASRSCRS